MNHLHQLIRSYEPWHVVLELAVIWICVYIVFRFLHGTRGAGVIKGFLLLVIGTSAIRLLFLDDDLFERLSFIYDRFLALIAIMLIVVFQPELRQAMVRLGYTLSFRSSKGTVNTVVDAVADAVAFLSKSQFGALIAIERESRLGGLIETGVQIDAQVSDRLIESVFWPNSPLHDLGVVIRGDRILAASVQFPLAEEGLLGPEFGSRHRAAAGLTTESDCIVVIVSEETGGISIAQGGRLETGIPREQFRERLAAKLSAPVSEPSVDAASAGMEREKPSEKSAAQPTKVTA